METKGMDRFVGLYSLQKTLKFELKPIGKTKENIEKEGFLEKDEKRAEDYVTVKKYIDEYHKAFISMALGGKDVLRYGSGSQKEKDSLEEFFYFYKLPNRDEKRRRNLPIVQKNLRRQIARSFAEQDAYKRLFSKELIREDLPEFVNEEKTREIIAKFTDFTTYFTGFHENRKNMYVEDEISTSIAYRVVNENLPKFIDNISVFEELKEKKEIKEKIDNLYKEMEVYLNVKSLEDMFGLEYFNMVLTQEQIDVYNGVIGGRVTDDGKKIQGLNEYVNLYNQQHREERLPKLRPLFKQILSDKNSLSWLPEEFKYNDELLKAVKEYYEHLLTENIFERLENVLKGMGDCDLEKIYIKNDFQLTEISRKVYGNWGVIGESLEKKWMDENPRGKKMTDEKYQEKKHKALKNVVSVSIAELEGICGEGVTQEYAKNIQSYVERIKTAYENVKELLGKEYGNERSLSQDAENVEKLKCVLDEIKALQLYVKPLLGCGDESDKEASFYGDFLPLYEMLDDVTPLYNKVRNYVTRKPYSEEKVKLNFDNSTLLAGWDMNKECDNTCVILRKNGCYYLAIMDKRYNKVFKTENLRADGDCYEKMEYKLLPGPNKMLPKVFFSESRRDEFGPSDGLVNIYKSGTYKQGEIFDVNDCRKLIDFFKASIKKHEDWKKFGFNFTNTEDYGDISDFYREVAQQGYMIGFRNVSCGYVDKLVEDGKVYLFQIWNKDFSEHSKGVPNMHTLYWKMLFDKKNLENVVYKLNGGAEVFFRKKSIMVNEPTHPANNPIKNKNGLTKKKESTFEYDLIKNRRYTMDKFHLHVPITMNFKSGDAKNINDEVNDYIREGGVKHVIGIDRGERHLLYVTMVDMEGKIVEQFSLNKIENEYNENKYETDYHDLLKKKMEERDRARRSWNTIGNIKELKEGYLSQVVHKIVEMMVKNQAIVVLEDLNMGFKRGRQKIETQVYQKFERALIEKLNYVVDKKKEIDTEGGVLKALQLTNRFESFEKLGKQNGWLFYIPAWNTSKMDPVMGFVNLLDTRYYNEEEARKFFGKFDAIRYNEENKWFEWDVDYSKFTAKAEGTRTKWTICTYGKRIETKRDEKNNNQFVSCEVDVTEKLKNLFKEKDIDLKGKDLKEDIKRVGDKKFYESLLYYLHLTLQMRNSITGTETDYLISPIRDAEGNFYDSRSCGEELPKNADANGAYNIARKGLWAMERIRESKKGETVKLAMSNKEWMRYAQRYEGE